MAEASVAVFYCYISLLMKVSFEEYLYLCNFKKMHVFKYFAIRYLLFFSENYICTQVYLNLFIHAQTASSLAVV